MNNIFIGKFQNGDQNENNYYRVNSTDENFIQNHFSGLTSGDIVFPVQNGQITKILNFDKYEKNDGYTDAKFTVCKAFEKPVALAKFCLCKYFVPDIVLLNKSSKQTKNVGFHKLQIMKTSPDIDKISFENEFRRCYVCYESKLNNPSIFRPYDICIAISEDGKYRIVDIVEFNGQEFNRCESFWNLYCEKSPAGIAPYTLKELLEYSNKNKDNAPQKENYIKSVLSDLAESGIFSVDNIVSLYDNIIVGRKRSWSSKRKQSQAEPEDSVEETDYNILESYQKYAKLLDFNPNIILYGPPGTGKTYGAMRIIEAYEKLHNLNSCFTDVVENGRAKFITFHQSFSYEEFVEGIRPHVDKNGTVSYPVEHGILRRIADECKIQSEKNAISLIQNSENNESEIKPYYLVIDEINRGNISKIFGELITLLEKDKRNKLSCILPYSKDSFTLPENLYIIGTMNTSDRSIAQLDTALRRRFAFIPVNPDINIIENEHPTIGGTVSPAKLLSHINNKIKSLLDCDHLIGHSYFLGDDINGKSDLYNVWYYKIVPLLMEYFYNDSKQVSEIIGNKFIDSSTGEVIYLSLKSNGNNVSDFEMALTEIYKEDN